MTQTEFLVDVYREQLLFPFLHVYKKEQLMNFTVYIYIYNKQYRIVYKETTNLWTSHDKPLPLSLSLLEPLFPSLHPTCQGERQQWPA